MEILSIHAHPDDAEILAGGTLALLVDAGHHVTIVSLTAGDCGSAVYGLEQLAEIRKREAAAAAEVIGASFRYGGFFDLALFNDDPSRRKVCGLIREIRPQVVLAPSPIDYHCDHEAASALVRDACFAASAPNYRAPGEAPALAAIPHLYFMDSMEGVDRNGRNILPDFFVNVGAAFDRKRKMLACHGTQRDWLRTQHG